MHFKGSFSPQNYSFSEHEWQRNKTELKCYRLLLRWQKQRNSVGSLNPYGEEDEDAGEDEGSSGKVSSQLPAPSKDKLKIPNQRALSATKIKFGVMGLG